MTKDRKTPEMQKFLDDFSTKVFGGKSRSESLKNEICVSCGCYAKVFRDEISKREYAISGLCQTCQDEVFNSK